MFIYFTLKIGLSEFWPTLVGHKGHSNTFKPRKCTQNPSVILTQMVLLKLDYL